MKKLLIILAVAVVACTFLLWNSGRMDPALSSIGLNRNNCIQNGFGATYCGDDAAALCLEVDSSACREAGLMTNEEMNNALGKELDRIMEEE